MLNFRSIPSQVFFVLFISVMGVAISLPPNSFAEKVGNSTTSETRLTTTDFSESGLQSAKLWQLSRKEWKRYQSLMQGPRGIWSPDLDPLSVLGIAATTDSERIYYAEKLAKLERARLQQELRFEAAYQQVQKKLFGHVPLFANNHPFAHKEPATEQRKLYFVKLPCDRCKQQLASLLTGINSHPLDIYLQGENGSMTDTQIRQWATQMGIPAKLVINQQVTLNHDKGLAKQAGVKHFPALMKKRDQGNTKTGAKP